MYWIYTGARVLICRDLRDRVVDGGGWSDSHTGWTIYIGIGIDLELLDNTFDYKSIHIKFAL